MLRRVIGCLVLCLVLAPMSVPGGVGESFELGLELSLAFRPPDSVLYVNDPVYFHAVITKPDPIDPGKNYTFSWDFDDTVDVDHDGTFDNDNDTIGRDFPRSSEERLISYTFPEPGRYNVTCTLSDGTMSESGVVSVLIRMGGVTLFETDKASYRPYETINVTWRIERGLHGPYEVIVINRTLHMDVFDESDTIVHHDEKTFLLPSGDSIDVLEFSFRVSARGEYRILANSSSVPPFLDSYVNETFFTVSGDPLPVPPVPCIHVGNSTVDVGAREFFSASGSHDPDGEIMGYYWDLGDGSVGHGAELFHAFDAPGCYTVVLTVRDNDDLTSSASASITVLPVKVSGPKGSLVPVVSAMAVVLVAMLAVAWGTEVGKVSMLSLGLALYTKLRKEQVLDHFTRGKILGYIMANPGEHYSSIKRALGLPNGTFFHHLSVLEKEGHIKSRMNGTLKRYYPIDMKVPTTEGALKHTQVLILEVIRETPGISQREVASVLGLSSPTVGYHVEGLIHKGHVRKERRGMGLRYYVVEEDTMAPL